MHQVEERPPPSGRLRVVAERVGLDRLVLLAVFAVSRAAYAVAGVRFDVSGLDLSSQLLDRGLLEERLVESVWYLHAQPPGWNLLVGTVLKASPLGDGVSFHLLFLGFGVVLLLGLHDLGRLLGLGRVGAAVTAGVISCLPATVLYENWLSYEYPVATLLVVMVAAGVRYVRAGHTGALGVAVGAATAAVLLRSLLHPLWLVAVVALLVVVRRPESRRVLVAVCGIPLLLVGGVMLKNAVLFGSPQLSSWMGFNAHKVAIEPLTVEQVAELEAAGVLGTRIPPPCEPSRPGVAALAQEHKPSSSERHGEPVRNFNHECLIEEYDLLWDESRAVAGARPGWVARNVGGSFQIWATPTTLTPFVFHNREEISGFDAFVRRAVLLDVAWDPWIAMPNAWPVALSSPDTSFRVSLTILAATAIVMVAAVASAVGWRRISPPRLGVLLGGMTVAYVTVVGNLLEYGENNRIRFVVEPLTLVLAVAVVAALVRWERRRRFSSPRSPA